MELYKDISQKPSIVWIREQMIDERLDSEYFNVNSLSKSIVWQNMEYVSRFFSLSKKRFNPNNNIKDTFIYIDISNVDIKNGSYGTSVLKKSEAPSRARKKLARGDILISTVRPNRNAVAVINSDEKDMVASTGFAVLSMKENIDRQYVFAALKNIHSVEQLIRMSSGGMYPSVSEKDVLSIKIPIPSLEVQKYVGDKVRRAEELRAETKKIEGLLYEKISSLFDINFDSNNSWYISPSKLEDRIDSEYNHGYFYDLKDKFIQKGFDVCKFEELIKVKMSEPQTDSSDFTSEGIPVLRISDIYEDYIDFDSCAKIPEEVYDKLQDFQLMPKDIIFGLSGTIGRAIVVPDKIPNKAITNRRIAKVTLKKPELAHYVTVFLNSKIGKLQLIRETTGGVQKNLRLEDISKVLIPIPDKEVINVINELMEKKVVYLSESEYLIQQAKQDVEDLIEGTFNMSKFNDATTESRC